MASGSGTLASPGMAFTTITDLLPGTTILTWTIVGPGFYEQDELYLFVMDPDAPPANAGPDSVVCISSPFLQMQASTLPPGASGAWNVVSGSVTFANPASPNTMAQVNSGPAVAFWIVFNGSCGQTQDDVVLGLAECVVSVPELGIAIASARFDVGTGTLWVNAPAPLKGVGVHDALGRRLFSTGAFGAGMRVVPWTPPQPGIYLVRLAGDGSDRVVRIVAGR